MKKKYLLLSFIVALLISGCSEKTEQPVSSENVDSSNNEIAEVEDTTQESLYQQFLENKATVHINADNDHGSYFSFLKEDETDYTLEELTNLIIADYIGDDETRKIIFDGIEYAYIDCGADGNEELAICIKTPFPNSEDWKEYLVIKEINGRLETVYSTVAWSRYYVHINENGYIYNDGSGGAASHSFDKSFINAEGEWNFLYRDSTEYNAIVADSESFWMGISSVDLSDEDRQNYQGTYMSIEFDIDGADDATDYSDSYIDYYCFAKTGDSNGDFDAGYKDIAYSNIIEDCYDYPDNSPIKKLIDLEGNNITPISEVTSIIENKEREVGLTDDMKNAPEADWASLDVNFEPYISTFNDDNFLNENAYFPLYFRLCTNESGVITNLTVDKYGAVSVDYNDYNSDTQISTVNIFTGKFVDVTKVDDYSYTMTLSEGKFQYTPGTEGYETLSNGYTTYRKYITPPGLENISAHFTLYLPGTPISMLPDIVFSNVKDYIIEGALSSDVLEDYLLLNMDENNRIVWMTW